LLSTRGVLAQAVFVISS